jgi:hypothetical protein
MDSKELPNPSQDQRLMPIILATQDAEIRRITARSQPRQIVLPRPYLKKILYSKRLVEWLKV